ncbi:hypothetical protein GOBAR_AA26385 [Gossypium barbadense]|uniref:CCHC-type domain-containing protein n=1 Tax=Gossypium barbadense TaxID=3634 RepID=A0A2P5WT64_GOSBA|nr:hypothetical protein GOBAR_AA26385 [Gossypium barbadense]
MNGNLVKYSKVEKNSVMSITILYIQMEPISTILFKWYYLHSCLKFSTKNQDIHGGSKYKTKPQHIYRVNELASLIGSLNNQMNAYLRLPLEGQNLFQIYFEDEDDLEMILDGRPWYFRKQLIIFDRLKEGVKRSKIKLVFSPFRLRVGSCPPECEKKDLMHAIGSTFGGILRSKIQNEICRMKVMVGARKPLRRGIFVAVGDSKPVWLPFKYESLPNFCFGCGIMGHNVKDCTEFFTKEGVLGDDMFPYSIPLKAESNMVGRESLQLDNSRKKFMPQYLYTRDEDERGKCTDTMIDVNILNTGKGVLNGGFLKTSNQSDNERVNAEVDPSKFEGGENKIALSDDQMAVGGEANTEAFVADNSNQGNHQKARWTRKG